MSEEVKEKKTGPKAKQNFPYTAIGVGKQDGVWKIYTFCFNAELRAVAFDKVEDAGDEIQYAVEKFKIASMKVVRKILGLTVD